MKLDFIKDGKLDFLKSGTTVKREREKKITRLHIILFFLVVITAVTVVVVIKVREARILAKYRKFENDLKVATLYYYGDKANDIGKGEKVIVNMKTIVDSGYLQDSLTSVCNGYTIIRNNRNLDNEYEIYYDAYIKCGNTYVTESYEDEFAK